MSSVVALKGDLHQDNEKLPLIACEQSLARSDESVTVPQVFFHPQNVQFSFLVHDNTIDLVTI